MNIHRILVGSALVLVSVFAQAQMNVTAEDREGIQSLAAQYAAALGSCSSVAFADLFEPTSGFFASGFRGRVQGRDRLIALVESERHCLVTQPDGTRGRAGGFGVPTVSLSIDSAGIFGIADLGAAGQYQDEYVRTPAGWRFASRTVLTPAEMAAGLDARQMSAIHALSDDLPTGDHYVVEDNGTRRFLSSGVVISVASGVVSGRVYLDDGGYYDDVYEQTAPATWRIRSREFVSPAGD